jgi:DNA-binding IclR family transcriptional regulator
MALASIGALLHLDSGCHHTKRHAYIALAAAGAHRRAGIAVRTHRRTGTRFKLFIPIRNTSQLAIYFSQSFLIFSQCGINTILQRINRDMKVQQLTENDKTSIQVIERMVSLLDALAYHPDPVSLKDLSSLTGLHPSTAHRILNDMVLKRFVDRADAGSYRLGMRLLELGNIVKSRLNVREAALDFMRALHRKTHQTINLSVRQGDEIVYIDRSFSERSGMQVVRAIGGRAPLHLTSTGKLFLSIDEPKVVRAYATRTGLAGHNKNSITDLVKLERELSLVRARGYARDNEELELGVRCMAAGIYDDTGKLIAGLSISAPSDRLQEEWLEDLVTTANQISQVLGFAPQAPVA